MAAETANLEQRAATIATAFGALIRERRIASQMTQDQLALATGVGRRFLIELEAGKPSCHLGLSLLVAESLGLRLADVPARTEYPSPETLDIPAPSEEEPDIHAPSRVL